MKKIHKHSIMDAINILDRISIQIFETSPGNFSIDFHCKEKGKQLVFDETAKHTLETKLLDLCHGKNAFDSNTRGYINEYVGRFIHEHYKVGLVMIEDIPEGVDDHYKQLRKLD